MPISAGIASRDITPEKPLQLFGYPRTARIADGTHDPLEIHALHFRTGSTGVMILSIDLLWLDPMTIRTMRARVAESAGIVEDRIFISCTHTHSGPVTTPLLCWPGKVAVPEPDKDYLDLIVEKAVGAAANAAATSTQIELAWLDATFRHRDGDHRLPVLAVRRNGHGIFALAAACDLCPAFFDDSSTKYSADLPFFIRRQLRKHYGDECGFNHLTAPCGSDTHPSFPVERTPEEAEAAATNIANAMIEAVDALPASDWHTEAELRGHREKLRNFTIRELPSQWDLNVQLGDTKSAFSRAMKNQADLDGIEAARNRMYSVEGTMSLMRALQAGAVKSLYEEYQPLEIQALQIGSRYLVGFPALLAPPYSNLLRERAGSAAVPVCLANGELQGLIVTPEEDQAAQYSVKNCILSPVVGENLINTGVGLLPSTQTA